MLAPFLRNLKIGDICLLFLDMLSWVHGMPYLPVLIKLSFLHYGLFDLTVFGCDAHVNPFSRLGSTFVFSGDVPKEKVVKSLSLNIIIYVKSYSTEHHQIFVHVDTKCWLEPWREPRDCRYATLKFSFILLDIWKSRVKPSFVIFAFGLLFVFSRPSWRGKIEWSQVVHRSLGSASNHEKLTSGELTSKVSSRGWLRSFSEWNFWD